MFYNKEQVQELNDELGEMEVWEYMRSKNELLNIIEKRRLFNKTLGETPESVLHGYISLKEEEQANDYRSVM
jgi:hypothetical protein